MSAKISLRELEKNVFQTNFQDGLLDIQIGSILLIFAIAPYLSVYLGDFWSSFILVPIWWLVFLGTRIIRKKIVQPRIGLVKFGSYRKNMLKKVTLVFLVINLLALILGFLSFYNYKNLPGWIHSARLSIIVLVGFSLAGYMLELPRLYFYGILTSLAPIVGEQLYRTLHVPHHGFPITFGISSVVIILTGVVFLLRILRLPLDLYREESE